MWITPVVLSLASRDFEYWRHGPRGVAQDPGSLDGHGFLARIALTAPTTGAPRRHVPRSACGRVRSRARSACGPALRHNP